MAELDELLAGALRDLAAEAPGLPPLSPRARRVCDEITQILPMRTSPTRCKYYSTPPLVLSMSTTHDSRQKHIRDVAGLDRR